MNRVKRRWFPKKPNCEAGVRGFMTVGIAEVKPALLFLLMGMGVSFFILFIEWLTNICSARYRKKRKLVNHKKKEIQFRSATVIPHFSCLAKRK